MFDKCPLVITKIPIFVQKINRFIMKIALIGYGKMGKVLFPADMRL